MSDPLLELKKHLLEKLKKAKGQSLTGSELVKNNKTVCRRLSVDESQVGVARDQLADQGCIVKEDRGRYRLTPTGEEYLKSLEPEPPKTNPKLFPYQQSFVLLKFFLAEDHILTQADLENTLRTREIVTHLDFGSLPADAGPKARPKMDSRLISWILQSLVRRGALRPEKHRSTVKYELTEEGEELLGASDQYPSIEFRLSGKELSRLIEAGRETSSRLAEPAPRAETPPLTIASSSAETAPPPGPPISPPPAPTLTADAVLQEFDQLRQGKYSSSGLVPIHDLRQAVASRYGEETASHKTLDPILMRLDREDRLRLVSIGDRSRVTSQQLADSIPGENETFFYVEAVHEHATVS